MRPGPCARLVNTEKRAPSQAKSQVIRDLGTTAKGYQTIGIIGSCRPDKPMIRHCVCQFL
jgi:hypothetical protein